jgi:hypothetical protein
VPDPPRVVRDPRVERAVSGLLTLVGLGILATTLVPGWGHDGRCAFVGLGLFFVGAMWFCYVDQIAEYPANWWRPPPPGWQPPE